MGGVATTEPPNDQHHDQHRDRTPTPRIVEEGISRELMLIL
jgi:hypothetical protein